MVRSSRTSANRAFTQGSLTFVLSHRNVKLRVITHGIGIFVLSHSVRRIVYLHRRIRAFTQMPLCFHTERIPNLRGRSKGSPARITA